MAYGLLFQLHGDKIKKNLCGGKHFQNVKIFQIERFPYECAYITLTRKHSNRSHTAHLPAVRISVDTIYKSSWGGRGQGSSSGQVWTGLQSWPLDVTSRGGRAGIGGGGLMVTWGPPPNP